MTVSKKKSIVCLLMALIVVLALCVSLTACSTPKPTDEQKQDATTEEAPAVENTESTEDKADEVKDGDKASTSSNKSSSSDKATPNSSSSNKASSNSSNTSSSNNSSSSHTHKWVKHDAVYDTEPVYAERVVCSCGKQFASTGGWDTHNQALVKQDPESGHSYSVKDVQVGTEKVLVEEAYYTCSCGATK